jgi:hypothetical protein
MLRAYTVHVCIPFIYLFNSLQQTSKCCPARAMITRAMYCLHALTILRFNRLMTPGRRTICHVSWCVISLHAIDCCSHFSDDDEDEIKLNPESAAASTTRHQSPSSLAASSTDKSSKTSSALTGWISKLNNQRAVFAAVAALKEEQTELRLKISALKVPFICFITSSICEIGELLMIKSSRCISHTPKMAMDCSVDSIA